MTDINFYHLTVFPLEKALPKLVEKVLSSGARAVVLTDSKASMKEIDHMLWSYQDDSFLPHGTMDDPFPTEQPVYITIANDNPGNASFLVTTYGAESSDIAAYERCLDLFNGNDDKELQQARKRWKQYKDSGHMVSYFKQNSSGGWVKEA